MDARAIVREQLIADAIELAAILEDHWDQFAPEGPTAYSNGRLPSSILAPIPGPAPGTHVYLERHAAAAWNAMNAESQHRYGVTLRPLGYASAYRTLAQQYYLWDHSAHPHNTAWVARPGTSNHGWGLAVDLQTRQMRWIVDQIGWKYGFSKRCSDAPVEWWHIKYNPGCTHATWHPHVFTPLRLHAKGPRVRWVQRRLRAHGYVSVHVTGYFNAQTRSRVIRFQRKHHLKPDGIVGPQTWRALSR
jgi:hypothetical protein